MARDRAVDILLEKVEEMQDTMSYGIRSTPRMDIHGGWRFRITICA